MKKPPTVYGPGVLQNAASEVNDVDADQLDDTLIGKISPQALRSAVIGQCSAVKMEVG